MVRNSLFICLFLLISCCLNPLNAASCNSNEYCPLGWAVKRKSDGSTLTCEPHNPNKKCPKPYMCVASKCGINFCCGNEKMVDRMRQMAEDEAENTDNEEL